jgi:IclR family transcriptional regulator, KDG regulon repressor
VASGASSLAKGLALLTELGSDEALAAGGLSVVQIAARAGREKSQVSRVLKVLAECGFVERDADTLKYSLSWELFALAARAGDRRLLAAAPARLAELVAQLGETAHLSVLRGAEVLTLLSEQPPHAIRAVGWTGRRVPAHCTASGRALLFDCDLPALRGVFGDGPLARPGPRAPSSVEQLHERIVAARTRGWAMVDEEFEPGLVAVAAPVRGLRGQVVAAVNVSAPRFRFANRLEDAGPATKEAADRLSGRLGAPVATLSDLPASRVSA